VAYLSQELGLTPNAIRQHLSALERDNLVSQQPLKTGPNRPALAFSLSSHAEQLFPKRYEILLSSLIRELVEKEGRPAVADLLARLGDAPAKDFFEQLSHLALEERIAEVGRIMEKSGSIPDWDKHGQGFVVRDYNCPYASVAKIHPEICGVQRSFLQRLLHPAKVIIACNYPKSRCEFHIEPE
jgi:predicted ArsR family transcriptional regulator